MERDIFVKKHENQRRFFEEGATRNFEFRRNALKKLWAATEKYEADILEAMRKDMAKTEFEGFGGDVGIVFQEIKLALRNLKYWMQKKQVASPLPLINASSWVIPEPLGVVLIISPWNYPFQLLFTPLVSAIAAGNCAVLKPSEISLNTALVIERLIAETFDENYIRVEMGDGAKVVPIMMESVRFDHVFFTGSMPVGKVIAKLAAEKLVPTTLEMGGKSPAIIDRNAPVEETAKRVVFGKFFNTGQTCVAPDYVLIPKQLKEEFVAHCKKFIVQFYGENQQQSPDFGRIISDRRFQTLAKFLESGNILFGGKTDAATRFIGPTLLDGVTLDDAIMREEIFGPILPILTFENLQDALTIIQKNPYPLTFYLFTKSRKTEQFFIRNFQFGGGIINHQLVHFVNANLPFGGVGFSGSGRYHGEAGFDTFSNKKALMRFNFWFDNPMVYPPYKKWQFNLAKWFLKHLS